VAPAAPAPESRRLPAAVPVASVDLDNAADGARATIKRGTEVKIVLDANITTGFQWQEVPPNGAPVLAPVGQRVYAPKSADIQNVGAGGINVFRFRGEQPGKVTLQFDYRRPWETVPPAKTVRYDVTVE
jgi:predicted secreted protein